MKRIIIASLLLLGAAPAVQADSDVWDPIWKHGRSDAAMYAAVNFCRQRYGVPRNGDIENPPGYDRCMLAHGWRLRTTIRSPSRSVDWTDFLVPPN